MQLNARGIAPLTLALAALLPARAAADGERPWYAGLRLAGQAAYFQQIDRGGIEQIDEDGRVFEGMLLIDAPVSRQDRISLRLLGDVVTSASIARKHNRSYRSLQSEASGMVHGDARLGWRHTADRWEIGVRASGSWDYCYAAGGLGLDAAVHLFERNTTLGLSLEGYQANLVMIRFDGTDEADRSRGTVTPELTWTQVLSPRTVLTAAVGYTYQTGFLAGQFNSVFVEGVEAKEVLPGARHRTSSTLRLKQGLGSRQAIELGGRYYHDDWGIDAGTGNAGYSVYLGRQAVLLDLGYRYYIQSGADAWASGFGVDAARRYQTSDPDLGPFMGHLGTLGVTLREPLLGDDAGKISVQANYYHRTNGLEMLWFVLGYRVEL